ncbi:MAG: serine hydrolase [Demequinaceae bacterium]|nr:serine hydrolase [Demequinaceae bacterium]
MSVIVRVALPLVLLLTACSPGGEASPEPSSGASYAIGEQWEYVLDLLADPDSADTTEIGERFHPVFLAQVPADTLVAVLETLQGDYVVDEMETDTALRRTGIMSADGVRIAFFFGIDSGSGKITELLFQPAGPDPDAGSVSAVDADEALATVAAQGGWAVYDTTGGTCEALYEANARTPYAIGSEFKLWILAAILEDVNDGLLSWSDTVTVRDGLKSTSDGQVYAKPDGTEMTIDELALLMISISDNTATDLLLDRVGRDRAWEAMRDAGIVEPERNNPFLSTREIFLLKLMPEHGGWPDLSAPERAAYLDDELAGVTLDEVDLETLPDAPWRIDRLEWFASAEDMCHTWLRLEALIAASEPGDAASATAALTANPGLEIDAARWPEVWYKGGSEPGVFAMTWRLVGADGREYVVAAFLNDPENEFSELYAIDAMMTVFAAFQDLVAS